MSQIRTFIALKLPAEARAALGRLVECMAPHWPERRVRWVKGDNMHLTLRFLGDTDKAQLPSLQAGLERIASQTPAFALALDSAGCFPNARRPRVIWVGLADPDDRLVNLQRQVERLACACGWAPEKRAFKPHLTLGRVREDAPPPAAEWMAAPPVMTVPVTQLQLIESLLKPTGAEYTVRYHARLTES
jgi:RNA 2',3'-cyclic 3'-phosphodiesterase